jgi:hypothetical protein
VRKLTSANDDADNGCVSARCELLKQLIRASLYVVDERAVADAILEHAKVHDVASDDEPSAALPRRRTAPLVRYRQDAVPR